MPRMNELWFYREGGTVLLYRPTENPSGLAQKPYTTVRSTCELLFVPLMANVHRSECRSGVGGANDVLRSTQGGDIKMCVHVWVREAGKLALLSRCVELLACE